ncbi:MAG: DNA-binding protein [Thermoproteota archaeon]|nr:MAG: DNA-binding protein [Candidatus Korarchaeota archaeon]
MIVPEHVLEEILSEDTLTWVSRQLGEERLQLYTPTPEILSEAESLVRVSYATPSVRKIELPEALCLVLGKRYGYTVLTENIGALMLKSALEELSQVKVWRALELLEYMVKTGVLAASSQQEIMEVFQRYEKETKHIFPRRELREVVARLCRCVE